MSTPTQILTEESRALHFNEAQGSCQGWVLSRPGKPGDCQRKAHWMLMHLGSGCSGYYCAQHAVVELREWDESVRVIRGEPR